MQRFAGYLEDSIVKWALGESLVGCHLHFGIKVSSKLLRKKQKAGPSCGITLQDINRPSSDSKFSCQATNLVAVQVVAPNHLHLPKPVTEILQSIISTCECLGVVGNLTETRWMEVQKITQAKRRQSDSFYSMVSSVDNCDEHDFVSSFDESSIALTFENPKLQQSQSSSDKTLNQPSFHCDFTWPNNHSISSSHSNSNKQYVNTHTPIMCNESKSQTHLVLQQELFDKDNMAFQKPLDLKENIEYAASQLHDSKRRRGQLCLKSSTFSQNSNFSDEMCLVDDIKFSDLSLLNSNSKFPTLMHRNSILVDMPESEDLDLYLTATNNNFGHEIEINNGELSNKNSFSTVHQDTKSSVLQPYAKESYNKSQVRKEMSTQLNLVSTQNSELSKNSRPSSYFSPTETNQISLTTYDKHIACENESNLLQLKDDLKDEQETDLKQDTNSVPSFHNSKIQYKMGVMPFYSDRLSENKENMFPLGRSTRILKTGFDHLTQDHSLYGFSQMSKSNMILHEKKMKVKSLENKPTKRVRFSFSSNMTNFLNKSKANYDINYSTMDFYQCRREGNYFEGNSNSNNINMLDDSGDLFSCDDLSFHSNPVQFNIHSNKMKFLSKSKANCDISYSKMESHGCSKEGEYFEGKSYANSMNDSGDLFSCEDLSSHSDLVQTSPSNSLITENFRLQSSSSRNHPSSPLSIKEANNLIPWTPQRFTKRPKSLSVILTSSPYCSSQDLFSSPIFSSTASIISRSRNDQNEISLISSKKDHMSYDSCDLFSEDDM